MDHLIAEAKQHIQAADEEREGAQLALLMWVRQSPDHLLAFFLAEFELGNLPPWLEMFAAKHRQLMPRH